MTDPKIIREDSGGLKLKGWPVETDVGYLGDNPDARPPDSDKQEFYYVVITEPVTSLKINDKLIFGTDIQLMFWQFPSGRIGLGEDDYHLFGDGVPPQTVAFRKYFASLKWQYHHEGMDPEIAKKREKALELYNKMNSTEGERTEANITEFSKLWDDFRNALLTKQKLDEDKYRKDYYVIEAKYITSGTKYNDKAANWAEIQDEFNYFMKEKKSPYGEYIKSVDKEDEHSYVQINAGGIDMGQSYFGDFKYFIAYDGFTPLSLGTKGLGASIEADQNPADWIWFNEKVGFATHGILMLGEPKGGWEGSKSKPATVTGNASANFKFGVWQPSVAAGGAHNEKANTWYAAQTNALTFGEGDKVKIEQVTSYSQMIPSGGEKVNQFTEAIRVDIKVPISEETNELHLIPYGVFSRSNAGTVYDQQVGAKINDESFLTDFDQLTGNTGNNMNTGVGTNSFKEYNYMFEAGARISVNNLFVPGLYTYLQGGAASFCNGTSLCTSIKPHVEFALGFDLATLF